MPNYRELTPDRHRFRGRRSLHAACVEDIMTLRLRTVRETIASLVHGGWLSEDDGLLLLNTLPVIPPRESGDV